MSPSRPAYSIERLASGSYDVLLDDSLVAALVRDIDRSRATREWLLHLLDKTSTTKRSAPFTAQRHAFVSRAVVLAQLDIHERGITDAWSE